MVLRPEQAPSGFNPLGGNLTLERSDRGNVAINVATQLTLGINERVRSSPPAPLVIDNTKEFTKTRPYKFIIELSDEDLLDRSIQIAPSPFVPSIPAIVDFAKYQALLTKGAAKTLVLQVALEGLDFDIPLTAYSGTLAIPT